MTTGAGRRFMFTMLGTKPSVTIASDEEDTVRSLIDLGLVEKVWEYQNPGGEPIYSSPIGPVTSYAGSGGITNQVPCIMFTSWDWYVYKLDPATGALRERRALDSNIYGRVQVADVNADGYNEIFTPGHDGSIWSLTSDGVMRWRFYNLYDREASGTITGVGNYYMDDSSKAWATNSFMRRTSAPFNTNGYIRFTEGANAFVPGTEDPNTGIAPTDRFISQNNEGTRLWISDPWATNPAIGDSYVIKKRYVSDNIFMHAGQLVNEGGTHYLYATCFDNMVYKINANTGALVWKYATLENIEPYPLVDTANNAVYVASIDGFTRRLNATTGALVWQTATGQCDAFLNMHSGKIWVSSRDNRVYRLDAATGAREAQSTDTGAWDYGDIDSSALPVQMPGTSGTSGLRIFVGGDGGAIWCFDYDLNTVWMQPVAPQALNSSPIVHNVEGKTNGLAVGVADMRGTMHFFDATTGKSVGKLYVKGGIEGYPLYKDIDGDGKVELVVTTTDGKVICYRFTKGTAFDHSAAKPGNNRWAGFHT